eukprot:gene17903-19681_t
MVARSVYVFLFALVTISILQVKKPSFVTPDGISVTLNVKEIYSTGYETHLCSSLWLNRKTFLKSTRHTPRKMLILLLLAAGDIELQPGPALNPFSRKRGFKILHQNINGIYKKIDSVRMFLQDKNIQCFGFTESHFNSSTVDEEISVDGYRIDRLDRKTGSYGGVICYLRTDINYERRKDLEIQGIEAIWIKLIVKNTNSILISFIIYRPPDSSSHIDRDFVSKLENMIESATLVNKEMVLAGDLNCDYSKTDNHKEIKDIFQSNALKQLIKQPTRITRLSKTLIDVCYSNNERTIAETIVVPSAAISDHDIIGVNRKMHTQKHQPRKTFSRNYSSYQLDAYKNDINSVNWREILSNSDFNCAWNIFKGTLFTIINKHAPQKVKMVRGKPAPWLTSNIKKQMHERDYYLKKARQTNDDADWSQYRILRNRVTQSIRQGKSHYCQNILAENEHKPSDFWRCIKKIYPAKTKSSEMPKMMKVNEKKVSDKSLIANSLYKFFSTIGSSLQQHVLSLANRIWKPFENRNLRKGPLLGTQFKFKSVTPPKVKKLLMNLKTSKASGPDQIPSRMLVMLQKNCPYPYAIS